MNIQESVFSKIKGKFQNKDKKNVNISSKYFISKAMIKEKLKLMEQLTKKEKYNLISRLHKARAWRENKAKKVKSNSSNVAKRHLELSKRFSFASMKLKQSLLRNK